MGYIQESPFARIKNIRLPQKIVQPFSAEDIAKLLACCDTRFRWRARRRAIILVLLDTGVRRTELVSLDPADLHLEQQRLRVLHGKGNKQRVVRIGGPAGQAVQHYLNRFRGCRPGPLFLACRGRRLCRSAMPTIFQRLGREASVPKVRPHRFRRTFAAWAIEQQAREIDLQFLLDHSSPAMLRRYTATYDAEKAAQAHALFSPADRLNGRLRHGGNGPPKTCVFRRRSPAISTLRS